MIFEPKGIIMKNGCTCTLRNACAEDAAILIEYLKKTTGETPFLAKEPDEVTLTLEQEVSFINRIMEDKRELMLIAVQDGRHMGNCSISAIGSSRRYAHRCSIGIALYQEYCGLGVGRAMLRAVLEAAKECGYEQAELEVVSTNTKAIRLYESEGFTIYGTRPHGMKYHDGTYADEYLMKKDLRP